MKTRIFALLITALACGFSASSAFAQDQFARNFDWNAAVLHAAMKNAPVKQDSMNTKSMDQVVSSNDTKKHDTKKAPNAAY